VSKIPDYTEEIEHRIQTNSDALITLGVKEWMRARKRKANMTEEEQDKVVRKIDEKMRDGG